MGRAAQEGEQIQRRREPKLLRKLRHELGQHLWHEVSVALYEGMSGKRKSVQGTYAVDDTGLVVGFEAGRMCPARKICAGEV